MTANPPAAAAQRRSLTELHGPNLSRKPTTTTTTTKSQDPTKSDPKEALMESGKQLVGEFRHGLWTLFEDLRQAAVGDEATAGGRVLEQRDRMPMPNGDIGRNNVSGVTTADGHVAATAAIATPKAPLLPLREEESAQHCSPGVSSDLDDGGWDNWDSPKVK